MNRNELIQRIAASADISIKDAGKYLDAFISIIKKQLRDGSKVSLTGFGSFSTKDRAARVGRNPQTGMPIEIKAAKVPKFAFGKALKEVINESSIDQSPQIRGRKMASMQSFREAPLAARRPNVAFLSYASSVGDSRGIPEGPPEDVKYIKVPIHYGTNRKVSNKKNLNRYYGVENAEQINYGVVEVSIPDSHDIGELERPSILQGFKENPDNHVMLQSINELDELEFYMSLISQMTNLKDKTAFIYIHGFKNSFAYAAQRTAQMTVDMFAPDPDEDEVNTFVAPIMYSWPSKDNLFEYGHDRENANESIPYLKQFLLDVSKRSGAEKMILIAHSMGGRLLSRALHEIGLVMQAEDGPMVTEIILAAPDIGQRRFAQIATELMKTGQRVTMYGSEKDVPLKISRKKNGRQRVGDARGGIFIIKGMDSIDASLVGKDILAHSEHGKPSILRDIRDIIKNSAPPNERFGIKSKGKPPKRYWQLHS